MTVLDQALSLGKVISGTDEYKNMKQAEDNLRANEEAAAMIRDLQMLQASFQRMQMTGHQLTEEHTNKMKETEERTMGNPLVKSYYEASASFHKMVEEVNAKIQEGITGVKPEPRKG